MTGFETIHASIPKSINIHCLEYLNSEYFKSGVQDLRTNKDSFQYIALTICAFVLRSNHHFHTGAGGVSDIFRH